jgi:TPP-dependent pyruvate/acetoin dehydrogenase alpha subunit
LEFGVKREVLDSIRDRASSEVLEAERVAEADPIPSAASLSTGVYAELP